MKSEVLLLRHVLNPLILKELLFSPVVNMMMLGQSFMLLLWTFLLLWILKLNCLFIFIGLYVEGCVWVPIALILELLYYFNDAPSLEKDGRFFLRKLHLRYPFECVSKEIELSYFFLFNFFSKLSQVSITLCTSNFLSSSLWIVTMSKSYGKFLKVVVVVEPLNTISKYILQQRHVDDSLTWIFMRCWKNLKDLSLRLLGSLSFGIVVWVLFFFLFLFLLGFYCKAPWSRGWVQFSYIESRASLRYDAHSCLTSTVSPSAYMTLLTICFTGSCSSLYRCTFSSTLGSGSVSKAIFSWAFLREETQSSLGGIASSSSTWDSRLDKGKSRS